MERCHAIFDFLSGSGWLKLAGPQAVSFLAAGEYNENHLIRAAEGDFVLRINHGSQLGLGPGQIEYEFRVLQALSGSGVTPKPFQALRHAPGLGPVLLMDYLPGEPLDYERDLDLAARIFAAVHTQPVPDEGLLIQAEPLLEIARESLTLITRFADHPLTRARDRLLRACDEVMKLHSVHQGEFADDPMCVVNTEVNSGNFIVDRASDCGWLVDWEKAVVSCRYQDLGHFLAPTTTLWKTGQRIGPDDRQRFLSAYRAATGLGTPLEILTRRTAILERAVLLRALSWCFMAYYEYTCQARALTSQTTLGRIGHYLENMECFLP
jgi:aminoglycoside phosphotransferase (APT) family kinase protein